MTPTEQDKELRESVRKIANHFELSVYENQKNGRNSIRAGIKLTDSILGLIAADRKRVEIVDADTERVALEARIDELERTMPHTDGMRHYNTVKNRIAELKQQLLLNEEEK